MWRNSSTGKRSVWTNFKELQCRKGVMSARKPCGKTEWRVDSAGCAMTQMCLESSSSRLRTKAYLAGLGEQLSGCSPSTCVPVARKCRNHASLSYRKLNAPLRQSQRAMLQGRKQICDDCDNVRSRNETRVPIWQVVDWRISLWGLTSLIALNNSAIFAVLNVNDELRGGRGYPDGATDVDGPKKLSRPV